MFMNDHPRIDEAFRNVSLTSVSGWPGSLSTNRFPVLRRKNGSPPIPSALSSQIAGSIGGETRSFKQVEYQANSPRATNSVWEKGRERCPSSTPRATWNRNVIIIAGLRIRMFFRSSNLLTYYTTRIDALGTMARPQERFPYYANASALPALSAATSSRPRLLLSSFSIGG